MATYRPSSKSPELAGLILFEHRPGRPEQRTAEVVRARVRKLRDPGAERTECSGDPHLLVEGHLRSAHELAKSLSELVHDRTDVRVGGGTVVIAKPSHEGLLL